MRPKSYLALGTPVIVMLACAVLTIPACSRLGPCLTSAAQTDLWGASIREASLLVGAATLAAWSLRLCHLITRTGQLVQQLPVRPHPPELREAMDRTGAAPVVCVETDAPLAFCAGALRPAIYLSLGLVRHLRPHELDAVLIHEMHHSLRRDPLRYAVAIALKDVCFYVPLLGWVARHQRENAELRADQAVMRILGPRPLAGALWALSNAPAPALVAAFLGAAELRAAQVLGDPLPIRRPPASLWLGSAAGILALLATANCLVQIVPLR